MKSVELMSSQVMEILQAYEASTYNCIEGHRYRLQDEISQLNKQDEELNRLAQSQDSIQFLKVWSPSHVSGPFTSMVLIFMQIYSASLYRPVVGFLKAS